MTLWSIWNIAASDPARLALVTPDGGELTFDELAARSNQVARGLRDLGLSTGDKLAILLRNGPAVMEVVLAAMQSGIYVVPINFHSTASDIAYILENSEAKVLFSDGPSAATCGEALDNLSFPRDYQFCTEDVLGFRKYCQWRDTFSTERPEKTVGGSVMNYTSGTTGRPKGVLRPLPGLDADAAADKQIWILRMLEVEIGQGVHLLNSPCYHTAVINLAVCALHSGQSVVQIGKWDPELALQLIDRYGVTSTHMVATHFHRFLSLPEDVRKRYDVSSLKNVIHGAVPTSVKIKQRMMDWWGLVIYEYYGSSEVAGTIATPEHWLRKPGTVGKPYPITQIKILDDDGNPVPTGEQGWIYMSQGELDFQYYKDPRKTSGVIKGTFICVGDIGYLDDDGDLFLSGRNAEIIISGGVNIYPAAVEGHLLNHPAVEDVGVVGVPDEEFSEQVKAVVIARPGYQADNNLAQQLIEYCRAGLSHVMCPKSVDFVDSLPRDPTGKLYKQRLRDSYWKNRKQRI